MICEIHSREYEGECPDCKEMKECICKPMLDGGLMPRPSGLPLPLCTDPKCPIHGFQQAE